MKKVLSVVVLTSVLSGCASITQGTTQTIVFNIEPKDTRCVAVRDGEGEIGAVSQSVNTLTVSKDKDDIIVKCTALGMVCINRPNACLAPA